MSELHATAKATGEAALPPETGSAFLREAIEKRLKELRDDCAVKREIKRNAFAYRWARRSRSTEENARDCGPSDKYWDDRQAEAQRNSTAELEHADQALADFIAEHRVLMPPDWIGNDHGRLCWAPYLGGYPINQHYCQRKEGHEGNHADEWPETRWACEHPAGSWPQGVSNDREWREAYERQNTELGHGSDPLASANGSPKL